MTASERTSRAAIPDTFRERYSKAGVRFREDGVEGAAFKIRGQQHGGPRNGQDHAEPRHRAQGDRLEEPQFLFAGETGQPLAGRRRGHDESKHDQHRAKGDQKEKRPHAQELGERIGGKRPRPLEGKSPVRPPRVEAGFAHHVGSFPVPRTPPPVASRKSFSSVVRGRPDLLTTDAFPAITRCTSSINSGVAFSRTISV